MNYLAMGIALGALALHVPRTKRLGWAVFVVWLGLVVYLAPYMI